MAALVLCDGANAALLLCCFHAQLDIWPPPGGIYAVTWLLLQGLYKLKLYWHCVVIRFCIYKYM